MSFHWPWQKRQKVVIVRPKRHRATAEELAERQKSKLEREKALLKAAIERAKLETELKRLQGGEEESGKNNLALDIDDLPAIKRKLRKVGLDVTSTAEGVPTEDDGGGIGAIFGLVAREFGRGMGTSLRETVVNLVQAASPAVGPTTMAAITAPSQPQPVQEAPSAPAAVAEAQGAEVSTPPTDSQQLIAVFDGKTAEQAAEWLTSQQSPIFRQLCLLLRNTRDDQLPALLDQLPVRAPQLANFVAWLRQRPEWMLAAVQAVKRSGESPEAVGMGL